MLAMKTGTEDLAHLIADDSRFGQLAVGKKLPIDQAPILINNDIERIAEQLQPIEGKPLHFTISTKMVNEIRNELMPFFDLGLPRQSRQAGAGASGTRRPHCR